MAFLQDTFTDTAGTLLENHTPDVGGVWTKITGTGSLDITAGGQCRLASTITGTVLYSNGANPGQSSYYVEARVASTGVDSASQVVGVVTRKQAGADTYYRAVLFGGAAGSRGVKLTKVVAGTATDLGTYLFDWVANTGYILRLEVTPSNKRVFIDGVERIASTDNEVTGAGTAGLYGVGDGATARTWDNLFCALVFNELNLLITSVAGLSESDLQTFKEINKLLNLGSIINETDGKAYLELNKLLACLTLLNKTDIITYGELAKVLIIFGDTEVFQGSFKRLERSGSTFTMITRESWRIP